MHFQKMGDPPTDERLWRYMALWKFAYLLGKRAGQPTDRPQLWFTSPQKLEDQTEGDLGADAPAVTHWWHAVRVPELRPDPEWPRKFVDAWNGRNASVTGEGISAEYRKSTLVSCWCQSNEESLRMWDEYAEGAGIAVVSSVPRLESALGHWRNEDVIAWRGRVRYGDSLAEVEPNYRNVGPVSVGFVKKLKFSWEREFRVATLDHRTPKMDGRGFDVDLDILVERIVISPTAGASEIAEARELIDRLRPTLADRVSGSTLHSN